jgi:hypothetical protein
VEFQAKILVPGDASQAPTVHQLERISVIGKLTCGMDRMAERVCVCRNPTGR